MKKYIPLLLVETYLILSLLIFYFGPVNFRIHNEDLFLILFVLYHFSFIFGYFIFTKTFNYNKVPFENKFSSSMFYATFAFGFFGVLNTYHNLMFTPSIIPFSIIDDVIRGLTEPGLAYTERMLNNPFSVGGASSSRVLNILSIFFSFTKLFFIFLFLYYWPNLSFFQKCLAIIYSLFFISAGIASGTNSVIFIFFIFFAFSLLIIIYIKKPEIIAKIFIFLSILFLIPIGFFGYIMSKRGGGFDYFEGTSPLGDISINIGTPVLDSIISFYSYALVWLNYYLVQGYYGFSLILHLDWNWTYGFGNSEFLQRQFLMISGIDISSNTFQYQIDDVWDKTAQWHSFYGQFANDFGFIGLGLFMFILGGLLSRIWLSVIYRNNFYGMSILPLFIIMFIFFPANNQIFGFIDTFSYFIFILIFWYIKEKKNLNIH